MLLLRCGQHDRMLKHLCTLELELMILHLAVHRIVRAIYFSALCRVLLQVSTIIGRTNTVNGRLYKSDPTVFAWEARSIHKRKKLLLL